MSMDPILVAGKAAALLPKGWEFAKGVLGRIDSRAQYDFRTAHNEYCTSIVKKYCRARTFFIRDEPQFLEDFYVPASIIRGAKQRIEKADLSTLLQVGRKSIVTGNGGTGKTIFMRYLLLNAIEQASGYPVFIELRNLNGSKEIDLEDVIVCFMKDHGFPLDAEFALKSLRDGLLVVLLDGFDEVVFSKRKELEQAIKRLASTTSSQIVLSSRPDMVLEGWDAFGSVRIAPLELEEACELIEKIRYGDEDDIKSRFVGRLRGGLFKSHQYFLSNPLLLSIMLLTYGDSAEIPKKFASFYEQAYTALFQKHDALKSGFRRERNTDLDIYEFAKLFSAFSAITYDKRAFRFTSMDAVKYVEQAKLVAASRDVDPAGFLEDARLAVCVLIEDGLDLAFVHRSFQEYFVARFINEADESLQQKYINNICKAKNEPVFEVDNVLKLLYEMTPALVEENYLIPGLKKLYGKASSRRLSLASWRRTFSQFFSAAHLHNKEQISYSVRSWDKLALVLFVENNLLNKKAGPRQPRVSHDLASHFKDEPTIEFSHLNDRSPIWSDMAENHGSFSQKILEEVRIELRAMEVRARQRKAAIGSIFSFSSV